MRVLIGVDGSQCAEKAIEFYLKRHQVGDDVIIVPLIKPDSLSEQSNHPQNINNEIKGHSIVFTDCDSTLKAKEILTENNIAYRTVPLEGSIGSAVCHVVQEEGVDMIIIGEWAHGGLGRLLLRPVYDHVIKHAKVPIAICSNRQTHVMKHVYGKGQVTWID